MRRRFVAMLLLASLLQACGATASSGATASGANGSLTVFAASSLTGAFTRIGSEFEKRHRGTAIHFSFAGSSTLVTQIQQGAVADVIASADQTNMQKLVESHALQSPPLVFARNRLAIVVAAGNPRNISGLRDLDRPGLIVVLCAGAVPCGRYGSQALNKASVSVKGASLETDVKAVVSKVSLGEADAGIVYVTDVKAAGSRVQGIAIPDAENVIAEYPFAILKETQNLALARTFVAYVLETDSAGGQSTLRQYGFLGP